MTLPTVGTTHSPGTNVETQSVPPGGSMTLPYKKTTFFVHIPLIFPPFSMKYRPLFVSEKSGIITVTM